MAHNGSIPSDSTAPATSINTPSELILGSIREAVVMTDLHGIVTYWNAAAARLFGWSADEMLGQHYVARIPAERREGINAKIAERAGGTDWEGEYEDRHKDGSPLWIRSLFRRIAGPDGQAVGILGVSQDITQERQARKDAQAQVALERAVLDSMSANIAVLDAQGTIRAVNRSWRDFAKQNAPSGMETTPRTDIGTNYLEVLQSSEDIMGVGGDDVRRALVQVLGKQRSSFSVEYPCHSPQTARWFRMSVTPLEHEDGGAVIAHTDITERVMSELRSKQDGQRLQLALAAARMAVWSRDVRSGQVSYSPEVDQILRRANIGIGPHNLCSAIHPDDAAEMSIKFARSVAEHCDFQGTFRIACFDGSVLWLHTIAKLQFGHDGQAERLVGTLQDVTALRTDRMAALRKTQILRQIAQGAELPIVLAEIARMLETLFVGIRCAVLRFDPQHSSVRLGAAPSLPVDAQQALDSLPNSLVNQLFCEGGLRPRRVQLCEMTTGQLFSDGRTLADRCGLRECLSLPLLPGSHRPGDAWLGILLVFAVAESAPDDSFAALADAAESLLIDGSPPPLRDLAVEEDAIVSGPFHSVSEILANAMYLAALAIDRQHALRDLRASEERFRLLVNGMSDHAVFMLDPSIHVRTWNAAASRLFGYDASDIIGQHIFRLRRAEDQDPELVSSGIRQIAAEGRLEAEGWWVRKDGLQFWGITVVSPLYERDKTISGYVVVVRDLTEKRRLDEQLRQVQRMDAIGRLASGVAQDFNNLLLIIHGYVDLLSPLLSGSAMQSEAMLAIGDAVDRAASLTRQLLAFSSAAIVVPKVLDLNAIVGSAGRMLNRLLGDDIRLTVQLDPRVGPIKLDPAQLDQIVLNLAMHARSAMPDGGTLHIQTTAVTVDGSHRLDFGSLQPGLYAQLSFLDNGQSIPEDRRLHLFEPFYAPRDQAGSTGLGLATVYGTVRQAGGAITVESVPNKGTLFRILFPVLDPSEKKGPPPAPALPRGNETLLVVEAEDAVRQIIRITLQTLGYRVLMAASHDEALAVAAGHPGRIDALLGDIAMQPMGAPALAEMLRAAQPHLKLLCLSTQELTPRERDTGQLGSVAVLAKPFTPHALANMLREILDSV